MVQKTNPGAKTDTSSLHFLDSSALKIHTLSLLRPDGSLRKGAQQPDMDKKLATKIYRDMLYTRMLDERMVGAQRQGRVSFYMTCTGEEASVIGAMAPFSAHDMVMCQYREQAALRFRGFSTEQFMNQLFSNSKDLGKGRQMPIHYGSRELNFMTISSPLATQIPQAAGYAYGQKLAGKKACTLCFFGEGAASEGDFHAGLNMAAVLSCPVVFLVRNNGYAISTPASEQYAGDGIAPRGVGYGIKSIRVDGNDILAVYAAAAEARKIAMTDQCPVLIEAMSYRLGAHSTSDDPSGYRSVDEEKEWFEKDPVNRMKNWLLKLGWWDEEADIAEHKSCRSEILAELKLAEKRPKAPFQDMISDVYKTPPAHLKEQLASLETHVAKYPDSYRAHGEGGL